MLPLGKIKKFGSNWMTRITPTDNEYLNNAFNRNPNSLYYTVCWTVRSSDLLPNDLFHWGHLKTKD